MDPVSLGLGIAPLCLAALKAGSVIKRKTKALQHHGSAIIRFRKRLKSQDDIFRDQYQLLLQQAGVEESLAVSLLDDLEHPDWDSADLETCLRKYLGPKYSNVQRASEKIQKQINEFDEELTKLEDSDSGSSKVSRMKSRASNAIDLALHESKLECGIENLADSVNQFKRLRKTAKEFHECKPVVKPACLQQEDTVPETYDLVATHSTSFLETFLRHWSCLKLNGVHSRHLAKLFLETDASVNCVNFTMVLVHETTVRGLAKRGTLVVRVHSEQISWLDTMILTPNFSYLDGTQPQEQPRPAKVRRVTFTDAKLHHPRARAAPVGSTMIDISSRVPMCPNQSRNVETAHNLCTAKDVCHHVFEQGMALHGSHEEACIGYLTSSNNGLRHRLMTAQDRTSTAIQTRQYAPKSLSYIIRPATEADISIINQLKLALRLARSVLQYHSTSWWRRGWSLADLAYFDTDTELATSLSTLHIDAELFPSPGSSNGGMDGMGSVLSELSTQPPGDADADARLLCGIRNITLHSLGVALLQIGLWNSVDGDDIIQVRRAAERASPLGPRYDELMRKCLYCDFGFGDDLGRPQLRAAVYRGVVRELETLISVFEGSRSSGP